MSCQRTGNAFSKVLIRESGRGYRPLRPTAEALKGLSIKFLSSIRALLAITAGVFALVTCLPLRAADGVVGPGNCDEAGFVSVLNTVQGSGGGTLSFDCGTLTIPITSFKEISAAVIIDGGDRVTFDGGNSAAFFQVFVSGNLGLQRLVLRRGAFNAANVLENFGTLQLNNVIVRESVTSALVNYGSLTIRNSQFIQNAASAGQSGAAVFNDGGDALIVDATFSGNVVPGTSGTGGAIAASSGTLTVRRSEFAANNAFDGGALYIAAGVVARIEQSSFSGNIAGYGGAIESWSDDIEIRHSRFEDNTAQAGDGGAIWAVEGTLTVDYSQFTGNSAATTGGALSCYADILTVSHSAFGSNQSGSHGGALYTTCGFLASNSTFNANTANGASSGGGAIYHAGPLFGGLFLSTLADNNAGYGAGIVSESATTSVNVFASLLAGNVGGNCAGVLTSGGYNLSDDSHCGGSFTGTGDLNMVPVALLPFGDHGGPTFTRPPQAGNPGIDRVPLADCPSNMRTDQRGAGRPVNGACDSGAYEVGGVIDSIFADSFE